MSVMEEARSRRLLWVPCAPGHPRQASPNRGSVQDSWVSSQTLSPPRLFSVAAAGGGVRRRCDCCFLKIIKRNLPNCLRRLTTLQCCFEVVISRGEGALALFYCCSHTR